MSAQELIRQNKADAPTLDDLVRDLSRETYDRFMMGGWEPQDAHAMIKAILLDYNGCRIEAHKPS